MPNLPSHPSTKNSSRTQHCRLETMRKEEQKKLENWATSHKGAKFHTVQNFASFEIFALCKNASVFSCFFLFAPLTSRLTSFL